MANYAKILFKDYKDVDNFVLHWTTFVKLIGNRKVCIFHSLNEDNLQPLFEVFHYNDITYRVFSYPNRSIFSKVIHGPKRILYHLNLFFDSTSSRQKIFEFFSLPAFIKLNKKFVIKNSKKLVKYENQYTELDKTKTEAKADIIVYMRSDSINNIIIDNSKCIRFNVIRNLDTLFTKGNPVMNSDFVINLYPDLIDKSYVNKKYFGNVINSFPNYPKSKPKSKKSEKELLYALSFENLIGREFKTIKFIYQYLPPNTKLVIKLHGSTSPQSVQQLNKLPIEIMFKTANNYGFECGSVLDLNNLSDFEAVISIGSTINYEMFHLGVSNNFFIVDKVLFKHRGLYGREHLQLLINSQITRLLDGQKAIIENLAKL